MCVIHSHEGENSARGDTLHSEREVGFEVEWLGALVWKPLAVNNMCEGAGTVDLAVHAATFALLQEGQTCPFHVNLIVLRSV